MCIKTDPIIYQSSPMCNRTENGNINRCAFDRSRNPWVNIGSGNGLLPVGPKSSPELMLTYYQRRSIHYLVETNCSPKCNIRSGNLKAALVDVTSLMLSTHWGLTKMADIMQTTFCIAIWSMLNFCILIRSSLGLDHWALLTIYQHWLRYWLRSEHMTSHYLNQWWPNLAIPCGIITRQWTDALKYPKFPVMLVIMYMCCTLLVIGCFYSRQNSQLIIAPTYHAYIRSFICLRWVHVIINNSWYTLRLEMRWTYWGRVTHICVSDLTIIG